MTGIFKLKFREQDTEYYNNWLTFYPKKSTHSPFRLELEEWGYFDPRPQLNTNVTSVVALLLPFISLYLLPVSIFFLFRGWGDIYLRLPFDSGRPDESESPEYGINTYKHDKVVNEVWVYWGKKRKHIDLPWSFNWYRTSLLLKDGTWEHETKGKREEFYDSKWDNIKFVEKYPYTYTLKSGEKQEVEATICVEEREWRRTWLPFTSLFNRVSKDIKIEFNHEVGKRAGSWKGGVLGCGYEMRKGETALQALQRMSRERKF